MKIILAASALVLVSAACGGGPMFIRERPASETITPTPGSKFRNLATLAASDERYARRIATNLRSDLNEAGIHTTPASGRWDSEAAAYDEICGRAENPVDGVVLVSYSDVSVIDCQTRRAAYSIDANPSEGGPGIKEMTKRLIQYLRGGPSVADSSER